jgi:hypothetical protein
MKDYRDKQLKIHTDLDENYQFKVHEIESCIVTPEKFIYKDILVRERPVVNKEPPVSESEEDKLIELLLPGSSNLNKTFKSMMKKSLSQFTQKQKNKLTQFYAKIQDSNSINILPDTAFIKIVGQLLYDPSDEINKYVDMYITYYKSKVKE